MNKSNQDLYQEIRDQMDRLETLSYNSHKSYSYMAGAYKGMLQSLVLQNLTGRGAKKSATELAQILKQMGDDFERRSA